MLTAAMPRTARVVVVGAPRNLTQRGNDRQSISLADADRRTFLERLEQDCQTCGVRPHRRSCPLGTDHLVPALLCVDCNPVRAGMVGEAAEYPWSSAPAHAASGGDRFVDWKLLAEVRGRLAGRRRWAAAPARMPKTG